MKVSIIMAAYNVEGYIGKAVESILTQTEKDIELIIVDDASTDGTGRVASSFSDTRVRCIRNPRNSGLAYSRNVGMRQAEGEWIAFLDADDWFAPNRIQSLLVIAGTDDVDMIADDQYVVDEETDVVWSTVFRNDGFRPDPSRAIPVHAYLLAGVGIKPIIRREFLIANSLFFPEDRKYCEDFHLWIECLLRGARLKILADAYYYYRVRSGSLSSNELDLYMRLCHTLSQLGQDERVTADPVLIEAVAAKMDHAAARVRYYAVVQPLKGLQIGTGLRRLAADPGVTLEIIRRIPRMAAMKFRRLSARIARGGGWS